MTVVKYGNGKHTYNCPCGYKGKWAKWVYEEVDLGQYNVSGYCFMCHKRIEKFETGD